ncbi:MAG TPA: hypothetical protein VFZ53_17860 [Polyangiaceae bacterium]
MHPRILWFAIASAWALSSSPASAEPLPRLSAAVVCVPAGNHEGALDRRGHFCLLRLPAWFDEASVEVTPRGAITPKAAMKRLGADLELKF